MVSGQAAVGLLVVEALRPPQDVSTDRAPGAPRGAAGWRGELEHRDFTGILGSDEADLKLSNNGESLPPPTPKSPIKGSSHR